MAALLLIFYALAAFGYLWLVIIAFNKKTTWGLLCLFPPTSIMFLVNFWNEAKPPFALCVISLALAMNTSTFVGKIDASFDELAGSITGSGVTKKDKVEKPKQKPVEKTIEKTDTKPTQNQKSEYMAPVTNEDAEKFYDKLIKSRPGGDPVLEDEDNRIITTDEIINNIEEFVGSAMIVRTNNSPERGGRLSTIENGQLVLQVKYKLGWIAVDIPIETITQIVLTPNRTFGFSKNIQKVQ